MSRHRAIRTHLEQLFPYLLPRPVHAPAAVRDTLKVVGVLLEHHYILCQHNAYLVAVAVATFAAAILARARNYQEEELLHSLAGVGIPIADSHGRPVDYLGIRRQSRVGRGMLGPGCMTASYWDGCGSGG
jgi:hypothetical protein